MSSTVAAILRKAVDGERLTLEEGVILLRDGDLLSLGQAADLVCKRLHPEPFRTYNIDRNINYTNVCAAVCDFCAFYRKVGDAEAYVLDRPVLLDKIRETVELGGDQILMQGGLNPELPFDWYLELLRDIKAHFPQVNVHGFSPPEIYFFARKFKMTLKEVLAQLKDAGLGSLPGGGGEILVDRVRKEITRGKVLTDGWLDVHRAWHELGGISTATMMYGHIETLEERIEHMERVRQLQDETGGLTAFISWTFQPEHTDMANVPAARGVRIPQDPGRLPPLPRQRAQHPVVLGHPGGQDWPARPLLRRQRHGQPDDRGERGRRRRDGPPPHPRTDQAGDPRLRLRPPPAQRPSTSTSTPSRCRSWPS